MIGDGEDNIFKGHYIRSTIVDYEGDDGRIRASADITME